MMERGLVLHRKPERLLTVVRSYRRPGKLKSLLDSWDKTHSEGSEIIVYLSDDDPKLQGYEPVVAGRNYLVDSHRFFGDSINHVTQVVLPGIPYYQGMGDDHLYHTEGWDNIMISMLENELHGWGIVGANDLIPNNWSMFHHVSGEVYSWKTADHFNGIYPKSHSQYGADRLFAAFLYPIGKLLWAENAVIEHLCWVATGKGENDENQKFSYSEPVMREWNVWFDRWMTYSCIEEQERLLARIRNEHCADKSAA